VSGRNRAQSLAASPTMVGAITVLVAVVAVFLAYQANTGLPFVPTYRISAQVPNANTMVPGNEVRIGGVQVGSIEEITPVQEEDGSVHAKVDLKLEESVRPIPVNSTVTVRSRSALGLKYLEIRRGNSDDGFPEGSTMPLSSAKPEPVDIDQVFNTFDDPTRAAIQINLREFGTAVAGRGGDLNAAFGRLRVLVDYLPPVMKNLASPQTALGRFVSAISASAAEVAPVAETQAHMFVALDQTFGAFADVAIPYIQESITEGPPTEDVAIATLPTIRPFLGHTASLFTLLQPGFNALRPAAPAAAEALVVGIPALRNAPAFNAQLVPTTQSLVDLSNDPISREGIDDLIDTTGVLKELITFVGPAQSVCNYGTLLFRNLAEVFSTGNAVGTFQRFIAFGTADKGAGANNAAGPSSAPANNAPSNFLHYNPYPNTASPGQTRECEAGNEPYLTGQKVIGNVPGNQGIVTEDQLKIQLGG
jgi:virulence factor Mce-like protein